MQLYLSSYKLGEAADELAGLFAHNPKVALIQNALDYETDSNILQEKEDNQLELLRQVGLEPEVLDLREYFGQPEKLAKKLHEFGGVWLRGGNTFILRRAMILSGFDSFIVDHLNTDFVYSGYSAGACAAGITLHGLEKVDDPNVRPDGYPQEVEWDGLGLLPYALIPHYQSEHPEAADVEKSVEYCIENKIPFVALRDGEVLLAEV